MTSTDHEVGSVSAREAGGELDPAEMIARVVGRNPSVASLHGGVGAQAATFLPGRRVTGVRITEQAVEVHVVARYGASLPALAASIRSDVGPFAKGQPVAVFVEDLLVPGAEEPTTPVAELPPAPG